MRELHARINTRRVWTFRDFLTAGFLMVGTSLGFVYLFPYDPFILGPLSGVVGFSLSLLALTTLTGLLFMRPGGKLNSCLGIALVLLAITLAAILRIKYVISIDPLADRDEALSIAWNGLVSELRPYSEPTQLGNALSPFIGGVLLFGPFMVLGLSEFFDVFYFVFFSLLLVRYIGWRSAAALLVMLCASSAMRWEILIQSDGWINAALVATAVLWFSSALSGASGDRSNQARILISSVFLALALAYRIHYAVVLIPLAVWMLRLIEIRRAILWLTVLLIEVLALCGLTFLVFPTPYGPQHTVSILTDFRLDLPTFLIMLGLGVTLAIGLLRTREVSQVLMWTSFALLSGIFVLGISSMPWSQLVADPMTSWVSYPPIWLSSFGVYPLTAHNAGILIFGLLALVLPRDSRMLASKQIMNSCAKPFDGRLTS